MLGQALMGGQGQPPMPPQGEQQAPPPVTDEALQYIVKVLMENGLIQAPQPPQGMPPQ